MHPKVKAFFDEATNTISYVVSDPSTKACAVVDSVLDYDPAAARTNTASADRIIQYVQEQQLRCEWVLETHVHADHVSAIEAPPYASQQQHQALLHHLNMQCHKLSL